MLPASTASRMRREAAAGKQSGRTQEIQRLIGRSLRAVVDMEKLGERQILIDCDVIQADGGTRTASITGAYVALQIAVDKLLSDGLISETPSEKPLPPFPPAWWAAYRFWTWTIPKIQAATATLTSS